MKAWAFLDIRNPLVAWECARGYVIAGDGKQTSKIMNSWMARALFGLGNPHCELQSRNEIILEQIRQEQYPSDVSRFHGMYFFEDQASAMKASQKWNPAQTIDSVFHPSYLTELELLNDYKITRVDSEWIRQFIAKPLTNETWMHSYWRKDPIGSPHTSLWELLILGKAKILNNSLKERAFENVVARTPQSEILLRLSQKAADLDFDFGHIVVKIASKNSNEHLITYGYDSSYFSSSDFRNQMGELPDVKMLHLIDLLPYSFVMIINNLKLPLISNVKNVSIQRGITREFAENFIKNSKRRSKP